MSLLWVTAQDYGPDHQIEESDDEIGRRLHPNVQQRQSGGIGHRQGDESRSIVGFMKTKDVAKYRDHDGYWNGQGNPDHDRRVIDHVRSDIRSGHGIEEPLQLFHDEKNNWGHLGEGNHRLRAAEDEGISHVPVMVHSRFGLDDHKEAGRGAPLKLRTNFDRGDYKYTPPDIHPDHFKDDQGDWNHE